MLLYIAPVFLPLIGAFVAGIFGRSLGDRGAQLFSCAMMGLSAVASVILFHDVVLEGYIQKVHLFNWITSGTFQVEWAIRVDELTAMMIFTVTVVSFLIHIYSIGYMSHDSSIPRFFSYLSLFTFFMLVLVLEEHFYWIKIHL